MARVNVYLPEDLVDKARQADLNVSALAQEAIRQALGGRETNAWLAGLPQRSAVSVSHDAALDALDGARDEAGTRHG